MKSLIASIFFLSMSIVDIGTQKPLHYGKIIYEFSENISVFTEERDSFFDEIHNQGQGARFVLTFSKSKSIFEIDSKLENDMTPLGQSWADQIVGKGRYYTDLEGKFILRQTDAYGEKIVVKSKIGEQDWNLTKEFKSIGKYKVFKATRNKTIENTKGVFNFEIVAWYCPEIPIRFGPKEYNGLPGLILELKDTHFTFHAIDIELMQDERIEIKSPKGKIYTEEEYYEKIKGIKSSYLLKNK